MYGGMGVDVWSWGGYVGYGDGCVGVLVSLISLLDSYSNFVTFFIISSVF